MKKVICLIFVLCFMFILASCGNNDEQADEIVHYYNEEWVPINNFKKEKMDGLPIELNELEQAGKKEEAISLIKEEMIPIIDRVIEKLETVETENKKIEKMNDMQKKAEQYGKEMSEDIIIYYEGGNVSEKDIEQYDKELRERYDDVIDYRDKLMDKYNLEQSDEKIDYFHKLKRAEG